MVDKQIKQLAKLVAKEIVNQAKSETKISYKQKNRDEVKDYKNMAFTTIQKEKLNYWLQPEAEEEKQQGKRTIKVMIGGWGLVPDSLTKVKKEWVNSQTGEKVEKEFDAVTLEKNKAQVQKLFVSGTWKSW